MTQAAREAVREADFDFDHVLGEAESPIETVAEAMKINAESPGKTPAFQFLRQIIGKPGFEGLGPEDKLQAAERCHEVFEAYDPEELPHYDPDDPEDRNLWELALGWREGLDTMEDFLRLWPIVKPNVDMSGAARRARERMEGAPPDVYGEEIAHLIHADFRLFLALCESLHDMWDGEDFPISCKATSRALFDTEDKRRTVGNWRDRAEKHGYLEKTKEAIPKQRPAWYRWIEDRERSAELDAIVAELQKHISIEIPDPPSKQWRKFRAAADKWSQKLDTVKLLGLIVEIGDSGTLTGFDDPSRLISYLSGCVRSQAEKNEGTLPEMPRNPRCKKCGEQYPGEGPGFCFECQNKELPRHGMLDVNKSSVYDEYQDKYISKEEFDELYYSD